MPRPCDVAPLEGASGSVRLEAGSDSFCLVFRTVVNLTLHVPIASMSHCLRICLVRSSYCRTTCTTHNSPACDTGVHDAMRVIRLGRNSGNSSNSRGDTEDEGQHMGKQSR